MVRVLAFALLVVGVALVAPRFAPGIFALVAGEEETPVVVAPEPAGAARPVERPAIGLEITRQPEPPRSAGRRASVVAAADGHFYADAMINGRSVPVVVDTGATVVVLTQATARQLGVFPPRSAFTQRVQTANGEVMAALVTLREVRLGNVSVSGVEALVVPGETLALNLLGMSFLNRLARFEAADGRLVLVQ